MPVAPEENTLVQSALPPVKPLCQDTQAALDALRGIVSQRLPGEMSGNYPVSQPDLFSRVSADDAYATRFDPAARAICHEYLTREGKDAAQSFPAYQQKMQDLESALSKSLPDDVQRKEFDLVARERMQVNLDAMERHRAAQTDRWIGQTGDAIAQSLSNRITEERHDFEKVEGSNGLIQRIKNVCASYGAGTGEEPKVSDLKAAAAIDKGLSDAVLTEAMTDPAGAKALYDRYAPHISSDAVRKDVLDNLLPAMHRQVYQDVMNRFGLNGLNPDFDAAKNWVMDPDNYKDQLAGPDQRKAVAMAIQGAGNRLRQFQLENQTLADNNFTDAIARSEIAGPQLQTWRDPGTGVAPSGYILHAAMEHDAKPVRPGVSDIGILASLADGISKSRISEPGLINQAYLNDLITSQDFRDLRSLYDSYRDPSRSRWLDHARTAFDARFLDIPGPNGANSDAKGLLPRFLIDLDQTVRDQDLKGIQIRQAVDKMLSDLDRIYVGQYFARMGAAQTYREGA